MNIRIYIDEDAMDKDLVRALRARGVDVITALEAGMVERRDMLQHKVAPYMASILATFLGCTPPT